MSLDYHNKILFLVYMRNVNKHNGFPSWTHTDGGIELFYTWLPALPGYWKKDSKHMGERSSPFCRGCIWSDLRHFCSRSIGENVVISHNGKEAGMCMVGGEKLLVVS